jgi:hypothetical protein
VAAPYAKALFAYGALRGLPFRRTIVKPGPAVAAVIDPPAEQALHVVHGVLSRDALDVVRETLRADVHGEHLFLQND